MQDGAVTAGVGSPRVYGVVVRVVGGEGDVSQVVLGSVTELNCFILQSPTPVQIQVHDLSSWLIVPQLEFIERTCSCFSSGSPFHKNLFLWLIQAHFQEVIFAFGYKGKYLFVHMFLRLS